MKVFVPLALFIHTFLRNKLSFALHDLEIAIIQPNAALKIAVLTYHFLRCDIKDITVQFIFLLLPYVKQVVLTDFVDPQGELIPILKLIHVTGAHVNPGERVLRGKNYILDPIALVVKR